MTTLFANHIIPSYPQLWITLMIGFLILIYLIAAHLSNQKYKRWPNLRTVCWMAGILTAAISVTGPIAEWAHQDFRWHMIGHLLLGMLAPLLLVLSAPMTLLLRTMPIPLARRIARLLRGSYFRFIADPIVASTLNIGGLWLLYRTDLFNYMHESLIWHVVIHLHMFLAGYVFTAAHLYIDPAPHRASFRYRAIVLVLALAAHGILSKSIYAYPPPGIPETEAQTGGMLMYYGGDAIDLCMIIILCFQWYKAAAPSKHPREIMRMELLKAKP